MGGKLTKKKKQDGTLHYLYHHEEEEEGIKNKVYGEDKDVGAQKF